MRPLPYVVGGTMLAIVSTLLPEGPREGLFLYACLLLGFGAGCIGPWMRKGGDR